MRVCFISNLYPPYTIGGAEINVQREAEDLALRGNSVSVISTSPHGKQSSVEIVRNVRTVRISPLNLYTEYEHRERPNIVKPLWHLIDLWNPHSYFLIENILRKEKPDVVHINNFKGLSLSVFTVVNKLNIPTIFTAHDCSLLCVRANLMKSSGEICTHPAMACNIYNYMQNLLVRGKINILTAASQFILNKLTANGLFRDVRAVKIPYGVELPNKIERKNYDIIDILYVGQVSKVKGVHILIDAIKRIDSRNFRLHIVGAGSEFEYMKKLANSDSRIDFRGFVSGEELAQSYQEANVVVVPSMCNEAFGIVNIEAFAYGTPVVVSDIGGLPELVEEGYNGYMFQPGDAAELSHILDGLIRNPERLRKIEEGAFIARSKYTLKEHTDKLEELYRSLLK